MIVTTRKTGRSSRQADRYTAFLEAYLALKNGITSQELEEARIRSGGDTKER